MKREEIRKKVLIELDKFEKENLKRLKNDQPIKFNLKELNMSNTEVRDCRYRRDCLPP